MTPPPGTLATAWLLAALAAGPGAAQPCDPELTPPQDHPYGYRPRGERCEGIYVQEVGGGALVLAGLYSRFTPFDPERTPELTLRWGEGVDTPVHLRARSLRRRLYYRMDAERPGAEGAFAWPTDLLRALELGPGELGILAWTRIAWRSDSALALLPLAVGAGGEAEGLRLVLLPARELEELYLSVYRVEDDGSPGEVLADDAALGYGYYPAARALVVPLPAPSRAGLYRLELGARLAGGGVATAEAWMLLPEAP